MRLAQFAAARVSAAAITLLLASGIVFMAIQLVPGSYEQTILGVESTPEARARLAQQFGLDRPLPEQYVRWLLSAIQGDLGVSLVTRAPVIDELSRRLPVTTELSLLAMVIALVIGLPLGFVGALPNRGRLLSVGSQLVGAIAVCIPSVVLGSVFVYVFSSFPLGLGVSGYVPVGDDLIGNLRNMVLPAFTLGFFVSGLVLRTTRDTVRSILGEPYLAAAVARGETPGQIARQHIVRNAAIPVLTVLATNVGYLLGGAVIVELMFALPGLGSYTLSAVNARDYQVVMAVTLFGTAVFVVLNLLVDLSYPLIDPRIAPRHGAQA